MVRLDLGFALDTVFAGTFFYCVLQASRKENLRAGPAVSPLVQASISRVLRS